MFPATTDVLTPTGWVPFKSLTKTSLVAQHTATGHVVFMQPFDLPSMPYDGEMLHVTDGRSICLCTTGDQPLVSRPKQHGLSTVPDAVLPQTSGIGSPIHQNDPNLLLELALAADIAGIATFRLPPSVSTQAFDFKFEFFPEDHAKYRRITSLCVGKWDDVTIKYFPFPQSAMNPCAGVDPSKFTVFLRFHRPGDRPHVNHWPHYDLRTMSVRAAAALVSSAVFWAGSNTVRCTSVRAADMIQALAAISGTTTRCPDGVTVTVGDEDAVPMCMTLEPYRGLVYGCTVPSGNIVTRYSGCVAVCGVA